MVEHVSKINLFLKTRLAVSVPKFSIVMQHSVVIEKFIKKKTILLHKIISGMLLKIQLKKYQNKNKSSKFSNSQSLLVDEKVINSRPNLDFFSRYPFSNSSIHQEGHL